MSKHIDNIVLELHMVNPSPISDIKDRDVFSMSNSTERFLVSSTIDGENLEGGIEVDDVLNTFH